MVYSSWLISSKPTEKLSYPANARKKSRQSPKQRHSNMVWYHILHFLLNAYFQSLPDASLSSRCILSNLLSFVGLSNQQKLCDNFCQLFSTVHALSMYEMKTSKTNHCRRNRPCANDTYHLEWYKTVFALNKLHKWSNLTAIRFMMKNDAPKV